MIDTCGICDGKNLKLTTKKRQSWCDLNFSYDQVYKLCLDCGFGNVDSETGIATEQNRYYAGNKALNEL